MRYQFIILNIIFFNFAVFSQQEIAFEPDIIKITDSIKIKLLSKSLEELMNTEIEVSSTKPHNVYNTPSTVSIIDKQQIEQFNYQSVAEAIRTIAGMDVYYTVLDQSVPTARGILQNFYANKILLLINGIPTWQPIYGNGQLERVDIADVERIEVLRGPASVLYGSNAYNGVINIILTDANIKNDNLNNTTSIQSHIATGIPRMGMAGVNLKGKDKNFDYMISANALVETLNSYIVQSKNGSTIYPSGVFANSDSSYHYYPQNNSYNFNSHFEWKNHSFFMNTFLYQHTTTGIDPSYKQGSGGYTEHTGTLLSYSYNNYFKNIRSHFSGYINYDDYKRQWPDTFTRVTLLQLNGSRHTVGFKTLTNISQFLDLELGADNDLRISKGHRRINLLRDSIIRHNLINDKNINEWSIYSQLLYTQSKFSVIAGSRLTTNSIFGKNISSRISMAYNLSEKQSLKFIYGEAFRTPQMLELYFNHPTIVGNINLKPETNQSIELAHLLGYKQLFFQNNIYYAFYHNMIQRITPPTGPPSTYRNISSFEGVGIESEIRIQTQSNYITYINYNYIKGIGKLSANNYKYVPSHTLRMGIYKGIKKVFISSHGYLISEVAGIHTKIAPQYYMDLQSGIKTILRKNVLLITTFGIENLTDSKMLTPEYIRQTTNINALQAMGYGRKFYLSFNFSY